MATSRGVDRHFRGLGGRNHDVRINLVTQPGNASKARPSHLTTADALHKVSPKDSPSKATKVGSLERCSLWTGSQPVATAALFFGSGPVCFVLLSELAAEQQV